MKKCAIVILSTALAAAQLSSTPVANAQVVASMNPADSPLYFSNADKNHNGSIVRSEVPLELQDLRTHFDLYDANHDHRLSEPEYVSYLRTLGSAACHDDVHVNQRCKFSPYSADPEHRQRQPPAKHLGQ